MSDYYLMQAKMLLEIGNWRTSIITGWGGMIEYNDWQIHWRWIPPGQVEEIELLAKFPNKPNINLRGPLGRENNPTIFAEILEKIDVSS